MGPVQVQHGEVCRGAGLDGAAGQAEDLPGPGAQGTEDHLQRHQAGGHQLGVENGERALQTHDAVEAML